MSPPKAIRPTGVIVTQATDPDGLDELRRDNGQLHLTISVLVGHEKLARALHARAPGLRWNGDLLHSLRRHEESGELAQAIEPLFNDIADRKRGLFVEDFLIDTGSIDAAEGYGENVCDIVDVRVPKRVTWTTEGSDLRVRLERPVRFRGARLHAFWVGHSNQSLSYHLSMVLDYRHDIADYYGLSLLQKVFFPTEGAAARYGDRTVLPRVRSRRVVGAIDRTLPEYVRDRFEIDVAALFDTVLATDTDRHPPACGPDLAVELLGRPSETPLPEWNPKCVTVLRDAYFFRLLSRGCDADPVSVPPRPTSGGTLVYRQAELAACPPEDLAHYFLSGYFQNVIDFLRQDLSEVQDGIDPIYPPAGVRDDASHFIVYATPSALYEVVSSSRSLNVGRGWIGTCPYLFLVHLMTLHNEDLVHRYENRVRDLIKHLEEIRLLGADPDPRWYANGRSDATFERFRRFRLETFEEVQRHRYFNVLRYDTERAFYESIEEVRGIRQREQYWAQVVADLEHTVDDLRAARQQHADSRRNALLAAVAVIGLLQVAFEILDYAFDRDAAKIGWSVGLSVLMLGAAAAVVALWNRRTD
jgi:hypothetical protein